MSNETRKQAWSGTRRMGGPRKPETNRKPHGDKRFHRLLTLALEDNPEAVADLFREFGFRYGVDAP